MAKNKKEKVIVTSLVQQSNATDFGEYKNELRLTVRFIDKETCDKWYASYSKFVKNNDKEREQRISVLGSGWLTNN